MHRVSFPKINNTSVKNFNIPADDSEEEADVIILS